VKAVSPRRTGALSPFNADTQSDVPKKTLEQSRAFSAVSVICPSLSATEERDDDARKGKNLGGARVLPVVRARTVREMR
jgi:hypothetical protein